MSEARLSAAPPPRRRIDRETTPGRCGNLDYCSIGMQRVLVRVPVSAPFVCPECGGRLRPPGQAAGSRRPWVLPALRLGVLAACSLGALFAGYTIAHVQPMVRRAVQTVQQHAGANLVAAGSVLGLNETPAAAPPHPMSKPPVAASQPAPAAPPLLVVEERPFPLRGAPIDNISPVGRLSHERRFGQVMVDCTLLAGQTRATCVTATIRGGDAFSQAAVGWLQSLNLSYHETDGSARDHRWRVVLQDFTASAPDVPEQ